MYQTNLPAFLFPANPAIENGRPHCPICGEAAETLYIDRWGMTVGCNICVSPKRTNVPSAPADGVRPVPRKTRKGDVCHAAEKRLSL